MKGQTVMGGIRGRAEIDREQFTAMWLAGVTTRVIKATLHIGDATIKDRLSLWDMEPRRPGWNKGIPAAHFNAIQVAKPTPKPAPEPVYHHGLSDAIKRAGGSVQRLGKVATTYRVPYREVMEMAGVQV